MSEPTELASAEVSATAFATADNGAASHQLVQEMPVAIVVQGTTVAVMMASPSDMEDFAVGFALTEGIIAGLADIAEIDIVHQTEGLEVRLWLDDAVSDSFTPRNRNMAGPVGCGLCGLDSLQAAARDVPPVSDMQFQIGFANVNGATEMLRSHQPLHDRTKAAHGAGFLAASGQMIAVREDVGRHNAVDKLIGALMRSEQRLSHGALVLTSRVSVELVQKAAMAGCPVLIAVSAPTTLAVETAHNAGVTLVAMSRGEGFQVFTHPRRIVRVG